MKWYLKKWIFKAFIKSVLVIIVIRTYFKIFEQSILQKIVLSSYYFILYNTDNAIVPWLSNYTFNSVCLGQITWLTSDVLIRWTSQVNIRSYTALASASRA